MASQTAKSNHATAAERTPLPLVESFTNGDQTFNLQTINLNRQQWLTIVGALSIASGQCAERREYEGMFGYASLVSHIGQRLGITQTGDVSPPLAMGATAGT